MGTMRYSRPGEVVSWEVKGVKRIVALADGSIHGVDEHNRPVVILPAGSTVMEMEYDEVKTEQDAVDTSAVIAVRPIPPYPVPVRTLHERNTHPQSGQNPITGRPIPNPTPPRPTPPQPMPNTERVNPDKAEEFMAGGNEDTQEIKLPKAGLMGGLLVTGGGGTKTMRVTGAVVGKRSSTTRNGPQHRRSKRS